MPNFKKGDILIFQNFLYVERRLYRKKTNNCTEFVNRSMIIKVNSLKLFSLEIKI